MGIDFGSLIVDLETLVSSSKEDFSNKFWGSYENYVNKYNLLLKDLQSLGFFKEMKFIEQVPFSDQAFDSGFTKHEQAKLREVTNESNSLLQKVKLLLSPPKSDNRMNNQVRSNKIFVIHGHDNEMKSDVTQTLQKLDLDPLILHEKPNSEQTLIEKISDYAHVSFAVVLLSPDDLAYPEQKTPEEAKYRAKQNVIFELGYFLGLLGKQNVIAIYRKKKDFEIPNNYNGVLWIEYKTGWYFELIRELQAANFDVDANKLGWL
ncbi:nucleotide-binding protein [Candidatus Bathyarchaeota archaeon]|nr:nucleotide-binding protein [Candidatus Bathyarchaeota archaeon]